MLADCLAQADAIFQTGIGHRHGGGRAAGRKSHHQRVARAANQFQRPDPRAQPHAHPDNRPIAAAAPKSPPAQKPPARQNRDICRRAIRAVTMPNTASGITSNTQCSTITSALNATRVNSSTLPIGSMPQPPQGHAKRQGQKNHRQHPAVVSQRAEQALGNVVQKLRQRIAAAFSACVDLRAARPARSNCPAAPRWPPPGRSESPPPCSATAASPAASRLRRPIRRASAPGSPPPAPAPEPAPPHPQHQLARQLHRRDQSGQHRMPAVAFAPRGRDQTLDHRCHRRQQQADQNARHASAAIRR